MTAIIFNRPGGATEQRNNCAKTIAQKVSKFLFYVVIIWIMPMPNVLITTKISKIYGGQ